MIKTAFYISAACFLLLLGCKKKDVVGQQVSYTGNPQVNFNNYMDDNGSFGYHKVDAQLVDSFVNTNVEIKLTNTTATAQNDISIYLIKVDALVSEYNTINGTGLEPLSGASSALDFDFSKPVVMKKGTRVVTVPMRLNASRLDLNKQNALGVAILKVVGADLNTGAESKLVIEFGTRNQYDGYYQVKGAAYHPTYGNYVFNSQGIFACGSGFALITSGANSVDLNPGQPLVNAGALTYFAAVLPRFTVNQTTNKVAITTTNTTVFTQYPAYDSRYDPGTKTFFVKYGWSGDRVATDTFTYCGPR